MKKKPAFHWTHPKKAQQSPAGCCWYLPCYCGCGLCSLLHYDYAVAAAAVAAAALPCSFFSLPCSCQNFSLARSLARLINCLYSENKCVVVIPLLGLRSVAVVVVVVVVVVEQKQRLGVVGEMNVQCLR
jgi:hypothetical protein